MKLKTKKHNIHIDRIILGTLLILCFSIIYKVKPIGNIEPIFANAESSTNEFVINNWAYFCYLEESCRNQNPNATYEDVSAYLDDEISKAKQNGIIIPVGSSYQEKFEGYREKWNSLNEKERSVVFNHPIEGLTALNTSNTAEKKTKEYYGRDDTDNDNANAFKHAYWNALMVDWIGVDLAKEFADAHEYGQISLSSDMDKENNEQGREDGVTYKTLNDDDLALKIMERVSEGNYWRIENDVLVATDETGVLPEYWLNTTLLWNDEIRIDSVKWTIQGVFEIPEKIQGVNVVEIGSSAFANQTQMTSIILPNTITDIDDKAFQNCSNLTNINIPQNVRFIGIGTFMGCNKLNISVAENNTYCCEENNILYNKAKTVIMATGDIPNTVVVPQTVTYIDNYSFSYNSNLETVHIYENPRISNYAFSNCENLEKVYFYSYETPDIRSDSFINNTFTLYVPHSKQSAYTTGFAGCNYEIDSISITVTVVDGEEMQTVNTYYGAKIVGEYVPVKVGYTFDSCTDQNNNTYSLCGYWDSVENLTVSPNWTANEATENVLYHIYFEQGIGEGGTEYVWVEDFSAMPTAVAPVNEDYGFKGYYTEPNGEGVQYYDENMNSVRNWNMQSGKRLYACWGEIDYEIMFYVDGNIFNDMTIKVHYGDVIRGDNLYVYNHVGYDFQGFYSEQNGLGVKYFGYEIVYKATEYVYKLVSTNQKWESKNNGVLYAYWTVIKGEYMYEVVLSEEEGTETTRTIYLEHGTNVTITAPTIDGYTFQKMWVNGNFYTTSTYTLHNIELKRNLGYRIDGFEDSKPFYIWYMTYGGGPNSGGLFMVYTKNKECVAEGTLITLADGRQVPVESLTGNEMLLVWNLHTGQFESAPILFIDHDPAKTYKVVNLYFSDGTHVKVISEHAFFDFNLNEYVFLREDAGQYIGHWFNKQTTDEFGNMTWTRVQLANVVITEEYTTAWSPVTYGHLCIYVNGMLSMPGATTGLINIFEVDGESMRIDQEQYLADIETYGLFTYEEFAELYPVPEEMFNAVNGQYLKVSIGKGLIDYEGLGNLIESYIDFFA